MAVGHIGGSPESQIRFIPLSYSSDDPDSASKLITQLRPDWSPSSVRFTRFTDGITNTLLKAVSTDSPDPDTDSVLLRAYGNGTDLLIDRHRETQNHELLWRHGLAPELLARFENGMLYRYVRGSVTSPADLREERIYRAVARRLAQWHATVPCLPGQTGHSRRSSRADGGLKKVLELAPADEGEYQRAVDGVAPGKPTPNVWTVMQKWIFALPTDTEAQRARQAELQRELKWLVGTLSQREGLGKNGLVFAHCDLLSGNVIVLPTVEGSNGVSGTNVTFIDYEYATPSPAAFDIANHFAEWGGFDCDFNVLPTRRQRRNFITEYVRSYFDLLPDGKAVDIESEVEKLFREVDIFRGVPGFYWGIWALIQATISTIDFDYASYAEIRLGEYYAWKAEADGSRVAAGREMPLRERRWAQEE
ncbi:Kinase-like protein [Coniochaeta hoffmannii]|uniref:ethanolamine kinase n=1 Tax=Coniochaeta hoffmannii TaxID=91930 RepID=A0AA38VCS6_9PEZI|nr:Kinase-like protein [Coniochaeta hoffmannii]